jgi:hypothetical protein
MAQQHKQPHVPFGLLSLSLVFLTACQTAPEVHSATDPSANLSSYKTFGFPAQPGTNKGGYSTPLTGYFETAVAREMEARGFRKADSNPDLLVNFNANVKEQADIQSTPAMGYYGYRGGLYGGPQDVETVHYKVGTANVDVVDANQKKLLWEGVAEGELTQEAMKNPQAAVSNAVTQIFKKFPGAAPP